jgi:Txe/YoeB family toxin of Txe-Axe toxin-antitoxin module
MADTPKDQPASDNPTAKAIEKLIKSEKIEKFEIKEKPEKLEIKEKPEKHEHKEKPEKFEHKEKPEKFEHKEKPEKLEFKEKESLKIEQVEKLVFENTPKDIAEGVTFGNTGDPIEQRVSALEHTVASLSHFITGQQRPDLGRGALSAEPGAKKSSS